MQPTEIGRYKIISELGQGGFGTTYLAEDSSLRRKVAIKLARAASSDHHERFAKEAQVYAEIVSPHIARIYESGVFDDRQYLVFEYIKGATLDKVIQRDGPLPTASALKVMKGLASALVLVHARRVIHRDIKPSNVILREDDFERPTLLDFGVAGELEADTSATRAGQLFGTIRYMSPEQVLAKPQSVATDIYGLGLLSFEMLFGKVPFEGENQYQVVKQIVESDVIFPEYPNAPEAVRQLIRRCLEKDPASRPHSAQEVYESVSMLTAGHFRPSAPVRSQPPTPGSGVTSPRPAAAASANVSRYRIGVGIGAIISALLALFLIRRFFSPETHIPIVIGMTVAVAALPLGWGIRKFLSKRRNRIEEEATRLLFGAQSRQKLTETLALEVNRLIQRLERLDERIVGLSIAIMVNEFRSAKKPEARQAALMQMMELLEKIRFRMTPWYVRHDKLIAIVISVLTCLLGVATAVVNILKPPAHH